MPIPTPHERPDLNDGYEPDGGPGKNPEAQSKAPLAPTMRERMAAVAARRAAMAARKATAEE